MSDWIEDGVTPHSTGGYIRVERAPDGTWHFAASERLHRRDGPAIERANGTRLWYVDGLLHRSNGPAVERANDTLEWYVDGRRHRLDGPAVVRASGTHEWWLRGEQVTESEHAEIRERLRETGEEPDV